MYAPFNTPALTRKPRRRPSFPFRKTIDDLSDHRTTLQSQGLNAFGFQSIFHLAGQVNIAMRRDILSQVPSPAPLGAHVRFDCAGEADEDL